MVNKKDKSFSASNSNHYKLSKYGSDTQRIKKNYHYQCLMNQKRLGRILTDIEKNQLFSIVKENFRKNKKLAIENSKLQKNK